MCVMLSQRPDPARPPPPCCT